MEERLKKIKYLLDNVRKGVNLDGGDIEFIKEENGYIFLKIRGRCSTCHTMPNLVSNLEERIKSEFPQIKGIKIF